MTRADCIYLDGYRAALAVARAAASKIEASPMPPLRREMAAEALRSFADEAKVVMSVDDISSPTSNTGEQQR